MASHFSHCSTPSPSQELVVGNRLFHARLQGLYKQRLRLARATLRIQLETLKRDLRALYLHDVQQGVEDLQVRNSEKFAGSTATASMPIGSSAEDRDIKYSSSGTLVEDATKSSELIIQFTNKVAAYSSANLTRILDFSAVLMLHSKKTNTIEFYEVSSFSDVTKLCATHSSRIVPPTVSGSSTDQTTSIEARNLECSTIHEERVCEPNTSFPANEREMINAPSEISHSTKCSFQLVNISNEIPTAFYAREFDSLYFSDSRSVLLFDVSLREQRQLVCEFDQWIGMNHNVESTRNSGSDIETNRHPLSSSSTNFAHVEQGGKLCGNQAQIALFERDRFSISASLVGNTMTGVIHVPLREQTICGDSISLLTTEIPYFMNFGRFNFGMSFLDRHQGHMAYASNKIVPKRKLQMVQSKLLTLSNKTERDFFVNSIQAVKGTGSINSTQNVYSSNQSTTQTDLDSKSSGAFLVTSSFYPTPQAGTEAVYFKVTSSPLSFVVPQIFNDDGNDEGVLEIDRDGRAQFEPLQ